MYNLLFYFMLILNIIYCNGMRYYGYKAEHTYIYKYTGNAVGGTKGPNDAKNEMNLKFHADVKIRAVTRVDFLLKMNHFRLEENLQNGEGNFTKLSEKSNEMNSIISKYPLKFTFHDGKIFDIRPADEEELWALNIKRGILSLIQNSEITAEDYTVVVENDISGRCKTYYSSSQVGKVYNVRKDKQLSDCSDRIQDVSPIQYTRYHNYNVPPFLQNSVICIQKFDMEGNSGSALLKYAECKEMHNAKFKFAEIESYTFHTLHFVNEVVEEIEITGSYTKFPKQLNYEKPIQYHDSENNYKNVLKLIKDLRLKTENGVLSDAADVFSLLLDKMRKMKKENLIKLFNDVLKKRERSLLMNAFALIATSESIKAMKSVYENQQITQDEIHLCISSLVFIQKPSIGIIEVINHLSEYPMRLMIQKPLLTLSSLVHNYCKDNSLCSRNKIVQESIAIIEKWLKGSCIPKSSEQYQDILLSLKSLGNAGITTVSKYLENCIKNEEAPMELRLAAITAHRRIPCARDTNLKSLETVFVNQTMNVEIRIAAYLRLMQCATVDTVKLVKDTLEDEEVNQVGSFVWTHLSNLQITYLKSKEDIKSIVLDEKLKTKFDVNHLKYSRNYEMSFHSAHLKSGGTVESNVIFSPDSYIPKSATMNVSIHAHGIELNLFEIGARVNGFEQMIANKFMRQKYQTRLDPFLSKNATIEAKDPEIETMKYRINSLGREIRKNHFKLPNEPKGLVYMKIFGNEIAFKDFQNINDLLKNKPLSYVYGDEKRKDVDYLNSFEFLSTSISIPNILGISFDMSLRGVATVGLKIEGNMDGDDYQNNWDLKQLKIHPSLSGKIVAEMAFDFPMNKIGLRIVNNVHSNTNLGGYLKLFNYHRQGSSIDAKVHVPLKQYDIFTTETKMYLISKDEQTEIIEVNPANIVKKITCTGKGISDIFGMKLCSNLEYTKDHNKYDENHYPSMHSVPFKFELEMTKTDDFNSYELYARVNGESECKGFDFYIDTPGSNNNRKIASELHVCQKGQEMSEQHLAFQFVTPKVELAINGDVSMPMQGPNPYAINCTIEYNKNQLAIDLGVIAEKGEIMVITPRMKLSKYDSRLGELTGKILFSDLMSHLNITLDFASDVEGMEDMHFDGDMFLNVSDNKLVATASVKSKPLEVDFEGTFIMYQDLYWTIHRNIGFKTSYVYKNQPKQEIVIKFGSDRLNYILERFYITTTTTLAPQYNAELQYEWKLDRDLYGRYCVEDYTATLHLNQVKWKVMHTHSNTTTKDLYSESMTTGFYSSLRNIDYKLDYKHIQSKSRFYLHGLAQMNKKRRIEANWDYNEMKNEENKTIHSMDASLYYPVNEIQLYGIMNEQQPGTYPVYFAGYQKTLNVKNIFVQLNGTVSDVKIKDGKIDWTSNDHTFVATLEFPQADVKVPWDITSKLISSSDKTADEKAATNTLVYTYQAVLTKKDKTSYELSYSWSRLQQSGHLSKNSKKWFMYDVNEHVNNESFSAAIDIYKHFELNAKKILSDDGIKVRSVEFYWDKANNKKISLRDITNTSDYSIDIELECPDTKMSVKFDPWESRITTEIVWNLENPKKIVLDTKVLMFGIYKFESNLTTPFEHYKFQTIWVEVNPYDPNIFVKIDWDTANNMEFYFEKQSKTSNFDTTFELKTENPNIKQFKVTLNYNEKSMNSVELKGSFIYKDDEVLMNAIKYTEGFVEAIDFRLESPTGFIVPIKAGTNWISKSNTNLWDAYLNWEEKIISVKLKLKDDHSYLIIETPFEHWQHTQFEYNIMNSPENKEMVIEIELLDEFHKIESSLKTEDNVKTAHFKIISSYGGPYDIILQGSALKNELEEFIKISHDEKELISVKINGYIKDLNDFKLKVETNTAEEHCVYDVIFDTVYSIYQLGLKSSKYRDQFMFDYENIPNNGKAVLILQFPNGYSFETRYNNIFNQNLPIKTNAYAVIILTTPRNYYKSHIIYNQADNAIKVIFSEERFGINSFSCEWKQTRGILEKFHTTIELREDVKPIYLFSKFDVLLEVIQLQEHAWQPTLTIHKDKKNIIYLESNVTIGERKREVTLSASSPYFVKLNGLAKYEKGDKSAYGNNLVITIEKDGKKHGIEGKINVEKSQGTIAIIYEKIYPNFLFKYDCTKPLKALQIMYTYGEHRIYLEAEGHKNNGTLETKMNLRTSNKNWEKIFATLKMDTIHKNFMHLKLERNDRKLNFDFITNSQRCDEKYTTFDLTSDLKIAPKFSISLRNETIENSKQLSIKAIVGTVTTTFVDKQQTENNHEVNLDISLDHAKNVSIKSVKKIGKYSIDVHGVYLDNAIFIGSAKEKLFYMQLNHLNSNIFLYDITATNNYNRQNNTNVYNALLRVKHSYSKIDRTFAFTQIKCDEFVDSRVTILNPNADRNFVESIEAHLKYYKKSNDILTSLQTTSKKIMIEIINEQEYDVSKRNIMVKVGENIPAFLTISSGPLQYTIEYFTESTRLKFIAAATDRVFACMLKSHEFDYGLSVKLIHPRFLVVEAGWDPIIFSSYKEAFVDQMQEIEVAATKMATEISDILESESNNKLIENVVEAFEFVQTVRREEYQTLKNTTQKFLNELATDFQANLSYIAEVIHELTNVDVRKIMYNVLDTFIFKTIRDFYSNYDEVFEFSDHFLKKIISSYKNVGNYRANVKQFFQQLSKKISTTLGRLWKSASHLLKEFVSNFNAATDNLRTFVEKYAKNLYLYVSEIKEGIQLTYIAISDTFVMLSRYMESVEELSEFGNAMAGYIRKLKNIFKNILSKDGPATCILDNVQEDLKCILNYCETTIIKMMFVIYGADDTRVNGNESPLKDLYNIIGETWKSWFNYLFEYTNINEIMGDVSYPIYWNVIESLPLMYDIKYAFKQTVTTICRTAENAYNIGRKYIGIYQYLPFTWYGFSKTPIYEDNFLYALMDLMHYKNIKNTSDYPYGPVKDITAVYKYYSTKNIAIEPATNNVAMLLSSSDFVTFNQRHYQFSGKCSYLLMGQFVRGDFAVILNYEELSQGAKKRKSLSVITENKHYEVFFNGTILQNGIPIEYPVLGDEIFILKDPNGFTIKQTYVGALHYNVVIDRFLITCNQFYETCVFQTNGWNYGQIGGLLGYLDNENVTDLYSSLGYVTSDVQDFARSWKIDLGRKCFEAKPEAKKPIEVPTHNQKTQCKSLFMNTSSPLGHCYGYVDPINFYDMCVQGTSKNPCSVAYGYKTMCQQLLDIKINLTRECAKCDMNDMKNCDESVESKNSTDVVLFVNTKCKDFNSTDMAIQLENAFNSLGVTDNKYALVGYFSSHYEPAVFTTNQKTWNNATNVRNIIDSESYGHMWRTNWKNRLLDHLALLQNRLDVSKTIVFANCFDDDYGYNKYFFLHETIPEFLENGVKFNSLMKPYKPLEDDHVAHVLPKMTRGVYANFDANGKWAETIAKCYVPKIAHKCKCTLKSDVPTVKWINPSAPSLEDLAEPLSNNN